MGLVQYSDRQKTGTRKGTVKHSDFGPFAHRPITYGTLDDDWIFMWSFFFLLFLKIQVKLNRNWRRKNKKCFSTLQSKWWWNNRGCRKILHTPNIFWNIWCFLGFPMDFEADFFRVFQQLWLSERIICELHACSSVLCLLRSFHI